MEFTHQGASWTGQRDKMGVKWSATTEEKQAIIKDFEKAQTWAEEHDRPLSFVTRQAEKRGCSWAYWQFDSDFVVYDISNDKWVAPIRDALIPPEDASFQ
jgi:endoglucanase